MSLRRGRRALVTALAALAPVGAASSLALAAADPEFPPPTTLSQLGVSSDRPQVVVDSKDVTTVVWSSRMGIQARRIGANGLLGPIQTLAPAEGGPFQQQVAIDPADRVTVVWVRGGVVESVRLDADGNPGTARVVSGARGIASGPRVAVGSSGRATVVWRHYGQSGRDGPISVRAARLSKGGKPGKIVTLSETKRNASPRVAIDSRDRAVVVWQALKGNGRIEWTRLRPDGSKTRVRVLAAPPGGAGEPELAIDTAGRATVAWVNFGRAGARSSHSRITSTRIPLAGRPSSSQPLSAAGHDASDPALAITGDRPTVVWRIHRRRVQAVRLGARRGTPGERQTLAEDTVAIHPEIAAGDRGEAVVVWDDFEAGAERILAVRLSRGGEAGAVHVLSDRETGPSLNPQAAFDSLGRATVVWWTFGADPAAASTVEGSLGSRAPASAGG